MKIWLLCPYYPVILLMEEILHHLICGLSHYLHGFVDPRWCRISSINSSIGVLDLSQQSVSLNYRSSFRHSPNRWKDRIFETTEVSSQISSINWSVLGQCTNHLPTRKALKHFPPAGCEITRHQHGTLASFHCPSARPRRWGCHGIAKWFNRLKHPGRSMNHFKMFNCAITCSW